MTIVEIAQNVTVILSCVGLVTSITFWFIQAKMKDDFCVKVDCEKRHMTLENNIDTYRKYLAEDNKNYRDSISSDMREIKDIILRLESRFYEWLNKK